MEEWKNGRMEEWRDGRMEGRNGYDEYLCNMGWAGGWGVEGRLACSKYV